MQKNVEHSRRRLVRACAISMLALVPACVSRNTSTTTTADSTSTVAVDPLPSWNGGDAKREITTFVQRVTHAGASTFVPPGERVAVFDNDGTLWAEQPIYFQLQFALDRVKAMAPHHPEWKSTEPFKYLLAGDMKSFMAGGEKSLLAAMAVAHSGMTTEAFDSTVAEWFATARHPKTALPYDEMIYQPMVELLSYLRANDFKTFIVSGGGVEFMRAFAGKAYGIPPEQVIGSQGKLQYEVRNGVPVLVKLPEIQFVDDKEGKPAAIETLIGLRPIAAFGNSDGDRQMLEWTAAGDGARLAVIIHHDDADREWAYDRGSPIGALDAAWAEALEKHWTIVSMKNDWNKIFPR